jgi:deoxyadenosine/deoxycytidine kinase
MNAPTREMLYQDSDVEVLGDYLFNRTKIALHMNLSEGSWTPSKFKRYKQIFQGLLANFRDKRYTEVYATPFENDVKAQKLIALFGFKEFDRQQGFVLMKREV